ncbi:hypothetical protein VTK26DRAFT_4995 [Humicola hyalothermophila]
MAEMATPPAEPRLPRITIQFCTQCKWMLRAAYYAQELLSTFSTSLGEVSLQPATGGVFVVAITTADTLTNAPDIGGPGCDSGGGGGGGGDWQPTVATQPGRRVTVLWDRKVDGGFPETKELKRRVRDVVEPGRSLGHVDREYGRGKGKGTAGGGEGEGTDGKGEGDGGSGKKEEEGGDGVRGTALCTVAGGSSVKEKCEDCE